MLGCSGCCGLLWLLLLLALVGVCSCCCSLVVTPWLCPSHTVAHLQQLQKHMKGSALKLQLVTADKADGYAAGLAQAVALLQSTKVDENNTTVRHSACSEQLMQEHKKKGVLLLTQVCLLPAGRRL